MANDSNGRDVWLARDLGALAGLMLLLGPLARGVGATVAVIGAMVAAVMTLSAAEDARDSKWQLYLVGGGLFVAVAIYCRRGTVSRSDAAEKFPSI